MWEIHMLGLTRRGMETGSKSTAPFLDPTDEAGAGNGLSGTAPVLDPTLESVGVRIPCATYPYQQVRQTCDNIL